jgi:hypothetical protein
MFTANQPGWSPRQPSIDRSHWKNPYTQICAFDVPITLGCAPELPMTPAMCGGDGLGTIGPATPEIPKTPEFVPDAA